MEEKEGKNIGRERIERGTARTRGRAGNGTGAPNKNDADRILSLNLPASLPAHPSSPGHASRNEWKSFQLRAAHAHLFRSRVMKLWPLVSEHFGKVLYFSRKISAIHYACSIDTLPVLKFNTRHISLKSSDIRTTASTSPTVPSHADHSIPLRPKLCNVQPGHVVPRRWHFANT